ncbi:MAG: T9SS type A sorting domain-containing protein [Sphingobacteriales bacterium]|nr:MAG: T9SS type A sorting domain-containing protein [Sphingobacteriales bacterium]
MQLILPRPLLYVSLVIMMGSVVSSFKVSAQPSTSLKTSNPYRGTYQRVAAGSTGNSSFEIRGGMLWGWGSNVDGQLGDGTNVSKPNAVQIGIDNSWVNVYSGEKHTLGLKSNGTLWAWGNNAKGQLGTGNIIASNTPTQVGVGNIWVRLAVGAEHTLGLKSDGTLWAWGRNNEGQLGDGTDTMRLLPIRIGTDNKWVSIVAGYHHSIALKSDGTLWTWGANTDGQLGNGTTIQQKNPIQIGNERRWTAIAAGSSFTAALKSNGTLWTWGSNTDGQLGDGTTVAKQIPVQVNAADWVSIEAGNSHMMGLKSDGTLWTWGNNANGQLGINSLTSQSLPTLVNSTADWVSIASGSQYSTGVKADGSLWTWGRNTDGQLGDGTSLQKTIPSWIRGSNLDWLMVDVCAGHTSAIRSDGTLWAWGWNLNGQLGDSTKSQKSIPVQVGFDHNWASVAGATFHTVGLKTDGTLWAWGLYGAGSNGQSSLFPIQIGTDNKWVSISADWEHTLALKSDGTLWAWGHNGYGQLGNGTTNSASSPVQVGTDTKWVSASAGDIHSMGLKSDGTVWTWGNNNVTQLGIGLASSQNTPVQVGTDSTWTSVSASYVHSTALKSDGTLWGWGGNNFGQLGDGTIGNQGNFPVQIGTDNDWTAMNVSSQFTTGLKSNGSFWAWGRNDFGQLGDGTTTTKTVPAPVPYQTLVCAISRGSGSNSALIKSDRSNICFTGPNGAGQLGDGTTTGTIVYNCSNQICRNYTLAFASPSAYTQPLTGSNNRTDFQYYCNLALSLIPSGTEPVNGDANATLLVEPSVKTHRNHAYVQRHYHLEVTPYPFIPVRDSTYTLILYFDQVEFDAYNANNSTDPDLPTSPTDQSGKANLRITQYRGVVTPMSSYEPADYASAWNRPGNPNLALTPDSVVWNATGNRWEVWVRTKNFGGFFVHGNGNGILSVPETVSHKMMATAYPSPTQKYVTVEGPFRNYDGWIQDMLGRNVMKVSGMAGSTINVAALTPGIYLLKLSQGFTFKIIKE